MELADSVFDFSEDGEDLMVERIRKIFFWLLQSPLVLEYAGKNVLFLPGGQYVRLKNSREEEVFSWLDREGFYGLLAVDGYLLRRGRDENGREGLWIVKVIEVPFENNAWMDIQGMDECPFSLVSQQSIEDCA